MEKLIIKRKTREWGGNIIAFVIVIVVNFLANAIPLGGQTTGEISAKYPSLFTPAGYTFSIWGIIYLSLGGYVIYQALPAQRESEVLAQISKMFMINCVANASWLFAWHYDLLWISLVLMSVILITLVLIYKTLDSGNSTASRVRRLLVHLPFSLYIGWITVASIANISVVQTGMNWDNIGINAAIWTIVKIGIAGAIGAAVMLSKGDIAFALVVGWAALGIAVKQGLDPMVAGSAGTIVVMIVLLVVFEVIRKRSKLFDLQT